MSEIGTSKEAQKIDNPAIGPMGDIMPPKADEMGSKDKIKVEYENDKAKLSARHYAEANLRKAMSIGSERNNSPGIKRIIGAMEKSLTNIDMGPDHPRAALFRVSDLEDAGVIGKGHRYHKEAGFFLVEDPKDDNKLKLFIGGWKGYEKRD